MEKEITVGQNRIYLGENNTVCVDNVGEVNGKTASEIKGAVIKLMDLCQGKANILIDVNKGGKTTPEARQIFREFGEKDVKGKIAYWGLHPVARVIASFVMGITKKEDMRFFKTKEEALAWLKET